MIRGQIPEGAIWWLRNGRPLLTREAETMGCFGDPSRAAWQASCLHFVRPIAAESTFWSRADLRELGYGAAIDAHVQAGRCPPDDWRAGPTALVLPFRGP
jgi:hypothetical protein